LFHDHGSRYVGKIYNDDWMRDRGFLNDRNKVAIDLVNPHVNKPLVTISSEELVSAAIQKMKQYGISQIPVTANGRFVGSLDDSHLFQAMVNRPDVANAPISEVMSKSFPEVDAQTPVNEIAALVNKDTPAVLVKIDADKYHIITRHDLIAGIS